MSFKLNLLFYVSSIVCALFCEHSWSAKKVLPDSEKIQIIEEMAQPFSEQQTFFHWLKPEEREQFIQEKIFTPERYEDIMSNPDPHTRGAGIFIAEDVSSSARYGSTVLQIEMAPNTLKYIDTTDGQTLKRLKEKGITKRDVERLNPNVVIKYEQFNSWWLLKSREGITFKPVTKEAIMSQISPKTAGFVLSNRIKIGLDFSQKEERQIIDQAVSLIRTSSDGNHLLGSAYPYLSESDKPQIIDRSISLIRSSSDGISLLESRHQHLSAEDKRKIVDKTIPYIKNIPEGKFLLHKVHRYLSEEDNIKILNATAQTAQSKKEISEFFKSEKSFSNREVLKELERKARSLFCLKKQLNDI